MGESGKGNWFGGSDRNFLVKYEKLIYSTEVEGQTLLDIRQEHSDINKLMPYIMLFFGSIGLAISIAWFTHILLFMFLKEEFKQQFLNGLLIDLTGIIPFFGVCVYMVFALWMLVASMKGQMIFGMRFFLIAIHPLEIGKTMMNSLLFNTGCILLVSSALCQFCAEAFATFIADTATAQVFGVQIKYLKFFSVFYNHKVFYFMYFAVAIITLLWYCCAPYWKKPEGKTLAEKVTVRAAKKHKEN